jgi:hypothetical protein
MPFYASPSGNDGNPGTEASPFATLQHAQSALRGSSDKTAIVRGGTYTLGSNWNFDGNDNGETWIPYTGETPIIDGASSYGLLLDTVSNWTMNGFTFNNMGLAGLQGEQAAVYAQNGSNNTMRWNTFNNVINGAIHVAGSPGINISDNTVNGETGDKYGVLTARQSDNATFAHNLVRNTIGNGIGINAASTSMSNASIDRNLLIDTCTSTTDMGALYYQDTQRSSTGVQFTNNYILRTGNAPGSDNIHAIYLDDGASNVYVGGNIVVTKSEWGWMIHGGNNNLIENNIFDVSNGNSWGLYGTSTEFGTGGHMDGNEVRKNIVYSATGFGQAWGGAMINNFTSNGEASPNVHDNLYFSASGASIPTNDYPDSHPIYANPLFNNPGANDYSMSGSSPFFTMGGQPFATDQGPRPNPYAAPGAPIINFFTANPLAVSASGISTTLSWSTTGDVTSITLTPAGGSAIPVTGSTYSVAVTGTLTYTLAATNTIGTTTSTLTVSIAPPGGSGSGTGTGGTGGTGGPGSGSGPTAPTISSYTSTATTLTSGASATLNWSISGTTTAVYVNGAPQTGTSLTVTPTSTTTYNLLVVNGTASNSQSITITVLAEAAENIEYHQIRQGDRHGTETQIQMSDGSGVPGNLAGFLPSGGLTAIKVDPSLLSSDGSTLRIPASSLASGVYGQVPRGALNGANRYFQLDYTPASVFMWLVRNGIEQKPPVDGGSTNLGYEYAIRGAEIEYVTPPSGTDWHYVKYFINTIATPPQRVSATAYLISAHYPDPASDQWGGGVGFMDDVGLFSPPSWFRDASRWDKRTDTKVMNGIDFTNVTTDLDNGTLYLLMEQYHEGNEPGGGPFDDEFWIYSAYILIGMSDGTTQMWQPTTFAIAGTVSNPQYAVDQDTGTYAVISAAAYSSGGYSGSALSLSGWTRMS